MLTMMYLCSAAKKKASEGIEKPSLKTFDDPDPLFPDY